MKRPITTSILVIILGLLPGLASAQEIAVARETDTTRVVEHVGGETEIPLDPERIVSLSGWITDMLLPLGVRPTGVVGYFGLDDVPPYAETQLEGVARVGSWDAPNLEAILALEPDLILAPQFLGETMGDQFEHIAPTVYLSGSVIDPREQLRDMGRLLGMEAAARARIAEYEARLAAAREVVASEAAAASAAFMRIRPRDYRLYGGSSSIATLLYDELGFSPAPLTDMIPEDEWQVAISQEAIPQLGAEILFYVVEDEARFDELSQNPLWETVPAVRLGRAFRVPVYFYFGNVLADELTVESIIDLLNPAE